MSKSAEDIPASALTKVLVGFYLATAVGALILILWLVGCLGNYYLGEDSTVLPPPPLMPWLPALVVAMIVFKLVASWSWDRDRRRGS